MVGCRDSDRGEGTIEGPGHSAEYVAAREAVRSGVLPAREAVRSGVVAPSSQQAFPDGPVSRQILFGDLHVHSTFSIDAFVFALPLFAGEGGHPPADACDFARYCADLDFFSINDHAEGLIPERWEQTRRSIDACNARAGDPANPDLVAYLGWEWTQAGPTPETHYGHKNVILREWEEGRVPTRPITSLPDGTTRRAKALWALRALQGIEWLGFEEPAHFLWWIEQIARTPDCERGIDVHDLPKDCRENAETPQELFEKLDQWGLDSLVIPHGLAWGIHAPPGAALANQLSTAQHDPDRQRLIEVYSGHGNSEEYRDFPEFVVDPNGARICPAPTADYLPCCWRAGQLVRERCEGPDTSECQGRVDEAMQLALDAGVSPHLVLPDTDPEDWLDCDQCRDCFKPAANLRPMESAQYGAALMSEMDAGQSEDPVRFRWGFIASTDNHASRPGTGFKQFDRVQMTDARGLDSPWDAWLRPWLRGTQEDPLRAQPAPVEERGFRGLLDVEREASFMYPGGIVGVHATGRGRDAVWDALMRREVYGTSGPRMLLWFDLLNGPTGRTPMGQSVELEETPQFEVRAVGGFVQEPGCPQSSLHALSPERLQHLCRGECYHPSETRHAIDAIEVVRVRVQRQPGEPVAPLIEDPWRRFPCDPDPQGCVVRFDDPEFGAAERDSVYYVRALQEATPAINAAGVRAEFDVDGNAVRVEPCHGNYRSDPNDDCLAPARERAWSSPLYLDRPR